MAAKVATRKPGLSLDRVPNNAEIEILALPNDVEHVKMLGQLGIREDERAHVRAIAPLGGPVLLEIGGSAVAIARGVAKRIRVRVV